MKVLNYTTSYLAVLLLLVISLWAGIFYYAMLDEIYDSIDDGLDNQKGLILQKVKVDPSILRRTSFEEGDYAINPVAAPAARAFRDVYVDTLMYMQNEQEYEPVRLLRTMFHYQNRYYQLQVITSMVEEDDLVSELFYALLWLYAGLIATILIMNNFLLKRVWRPFYHLLKQLTVFKLEAPSIKTSPTRIDEFRLLNEAVLKLLQSNVDSYTSQRQFIENASHELQTPLAISIHKLEALAETGQLSAEQSGLLASAMDNLERLTRLNRSLLLLSKIENRQFVSTETVDMNVLVKRIAADFSDQLAFRQLTLDIQEKETLLVHMNADLATILVTNLFKNAVVHNHPSGSIHIEIRKETFLIANTGPEAALDTNRLFNRFYKERPSQTSTGLGLSIVKAIADLFHFTITYRYNGRHIMTVVFTV